MSGQRQVGLDLDAARPVRLRIEPFGRWRRGNTGRPKNGARLDALAGDGDAAVVASCYGLAEPDLDAEPPERPLGGCRESLRKGREHARTGLDQYDPGRARV